MGVLHLNSDADWDKVMAEAGGKKVLIDFTATWCGPCRMIAPFFEELAAKYPGLVFLKVDVDACADTAKTCGINAMPTFQVWDSATKKKLAEIVGADKGKLEGLASQHA